MLLAIDAGNSYVKFGVFEGQTSIATWRVTQNVEHCPADYLAELTPMLKGDGIAPTDIHAIVLGCVVPHAAPCLVRLCEQYFGVEPFIASTATAGMAAHYDPPGSLGIDRVADAVAAAAMFGSPCVAVDMGTATTFNVVDGEPPAFIGGAIAPGIAVMAATLSANTAALPLVSPDRPKSPLANTTGDALRSGIYFGYIALVDGIIQRLMAEAHATDCPVVATGGGATRSVIGDCQTVTHREPLLTLHGLRLMYERSRQEKGAQ